MPLIAMVASGCATGTKIDAVRVEPDHLGACTVWRIITWADADTAETIKQVKASNAARRVYCGGATPSLDSNTTKVDKNSTE